jgi:type I restriction enzyme S subunit
MNMQNNWQTKKLGEIAECHDGDWIISKNMKPNGEIRLIQLGDIGDGIFLDKTSKYISESKCKELKCTLLQSKDILLSRLGDPIGKSCIIPDLPYRAITAVDCTIIRTKSEQVLQTYLLYAISSNIFRAQISKYATGTTRKRISRKNLEKIPVPMPPVQVQRQIVEKLDAIRKLQELNNKEIEKAEELFNSLLNSLLKPKKDWQIKKLEDIIASIINGYSGKQVDNGEGLPITRIETIQNNQLDLSRVKFAKVSDIEKEKYLLKEGDILFSHINSIEHIGKVAIVTNEVMPLLHGVNLLRITTNPTVCNPYFLYYYFQTRFIKEQITRRSRKAVNQASINQTQLLQIILNVPSLSIQQQIVKRLDAIRKLQELKKMEKEKLSELFESALNKAMKGELVNYKL